MSIKAEGTTNLNFYVPKSEIPGEVNEGCRKTLLLLSKIDIEKDWGSFKFHYRSKDKQPKSHQGYPYGPGGAGGDYNIKDTYFQDAAGHGGLPEAYIGPDSGDGYDEPTQPGIYIYIYIYTYIYI